MLSRVYVIVLAIVILAGSFLYFSSNTSYKNSFQARVYYFLGNYEQALEYAQKAYKEDTYNKMAFTVLTQSKIARKYEQYIQEGNAYLKQIDMISSKSTFSAADRVRIKIMCEVMIDSYTKLVSTKLTDEALLKKSEKVYMKFKKLHEELF